MLSVKSRTHVSYRKLPKPFVIPGLGLENTGSHWCSRYIYCGCRWEYSEHNGCWILGVEYFFFLFGFYGFQEYFTYIERLFIKGGRKPENPRENNLTIREQNLAFPYVSRERLEPQRYGVEYLGWYRYPIYLYREAWTVKIQIKLLLNIDLRLHCVILLTTYQFVRFFRVWNLMLLQCLKL